MTPSPPRSSLDSLPVEIVLRIVRFFLDPRSITRLAQTCTTLYDIARSEVIWKHIVLRLVRAHGIESARLGRLGSSRGPSSSSSSVETPTSWWEQAKFLLPYAPRLGYFASSIPFSSRIILVSIVVPPASDSPSPPSYSIHAAQLRAFNEFSVTSPPPPHLLPFGAHLEITLDAYNVSRIENPFHPDAGISTDVLRPTYDFSAGMIDITRELGAVLSQPARGGGAGERPRHQLGLLLEPTRQVVHGGTRTSLLPNEENLDDDDGGGGPNELSREALLALFSGRLPRRPWPTLELVGVVEREAQQTEQRRKRTRLSTTRSGAFRAPEEWISERGLERSTVATIVVETENEDEPDRAFVDGFRLRAKRSTLSSTGRGRDASASLPTPPPTGTTPDREVGGPILETMTRRRRGIGRDGGMAVLWNGAEQDPDDVNPVTILRAGDQDQGGVVLRLGGDEEVDRLPQTPTTPAEAFAEALDAAGEAFFPIKPPATPISWQDPTCVLEGQDITAASLEGMWVGTYGSHGLEFVHLSTSLSTPSPRNSRPPTPPSDSSSAPSSPSPTRGEGGGGASWNRILTATKLTGDTNVPSGETTWIAFLGDDNDGDQDSHPDDDQLPRPPIDSDFGDDCLVPSISEEKWMRMNRLDPTSPFAAASGTSRDWFEGTTKGVGQIALSGFLQPGWTRAIVRFVRKETELWRDRTTGRVERIDPIDGAGARDNVRDEQWEKKVVESVEEIQLRWAELNKIAVFTRVRI